MSRTLTEELADFAQYQEQLDAQTELRTAAELARRAECMIIDLEEQIEELKEEINWICASHESDCEILDLTYRNSIKEYVQKLEDLIADMRT